MKLCLTTLAATVLLLVACARGAVVEPAEPNDVLTGSGVFSHLQLLADDVLEGRGAGTRGNAVAAAYAAHHFESLGLEPAGTDGTFFQPFILGGGNLQQPTRVVVHASAGDITFALGGKDLAFVPLPGCRDGEVRGEAVFAGYGITAPEHDYDDYAGLDVAGKVVLVLRHEPGENAESSPFDGTANTSHAFFASKMDNAIAHGAAAMILVTDPANHDRTSPGRGLGMRPGPAGGREPLDSDQELLVDTLGLGDQLASIDRVDSLAQASGIPGMHTELQVAEAMFVRQKETLLELQQRIDSTTKPASRPLGVEVTVQVSTESAVGRNVCALLPGSDPELAKELIVLGAHIDHLGVVRGTIHNGADDNASGTSGLLTVAEAFARYAVQPKRSLLFILFDGEESGLLGSAYFVDHPTVPLESVSTMVNIDMIGRNPGSPIDVVGAPSGSGLEQLVADAAAEAGMAIRPALDDTFMRSDQYSFYQRGVPVVFFSTGEHADYHRPTDDPPLIDHEQLERVTRLMFGLVARLASEVRPTFTNIDTLVQAALSRSRGPRLGVFPTPVTDELAAETGLVAGVGIYVREVVDDTAATRAGLQAGDLILSIGEDALEGKGQRKLMAGLRAALGKVADSGEPATMKVIRDGEQLELTLELGAPPAGGG